MLEHGAARRTLTTIGCHRRHRRRRHPAPSTWVHRFVLPPPPPAADRHSRAPTRRCGSMGKRVCLHPPPRPSSSLRSSSSCSSSISSFLSPSFSVFVALFRDFQASLPLVDCRWLCVFSPRFLLPPSLLSSSSSSLSFISFIFLRDFLSGCAAVFILL